MKLTATTKKIQVVLGEAITTNQIPCYATWKDFTATTCVEGDNLINTNNTTDIDLVGAPDASTSRIIDFINIINTDTVLHNVIVKIDVSGTDYIIKKSVLNAGERLEFDGKGFKEFTVLGGEKVQQTSGMIASQDLTVVVVEGDQVNNNATANTLQNVTGLAFDVVAGNTYYFEVVCAYLSAATTTGSRWVIDCPAVTFLNGSSEYTLTATTKTVNSFSAKQIPAASNASSLAAGNVATIWGIIKPSANGTVQVQFASEVSNSAITYKSGFIRYRQIV